MPQSPSFGNPSRRPSFGILQRKKIKEEASTDDTPMVNNKEMIAHAIARVETSMNVNTRSTKSRGRFWPWGQKNKSGKDIVMTPVEVRPGEDHIKGSADGKAQNEEFQSRLLQQSKKINNKDEEIRILVEANERNRQANSALQEDHQVALNANKELEVKLHRAVADAQSHKTQLEKEQERCAELEVAIQAMAREKSRLQKHAEAEQKERVWYQMSWEKSLDDLNNSRSAYDVLQADRDKLRQKAMSNGRAEEILETTRQAKVDKDTEETITNQKGRRGLTQNNRNGETLPERGVAFPKQQELHTESSQALARLQDEVAYLKTRVVVNKPPNDNESIGRDETHQSYPDAPFTTSLQQQVAGLSKIEQKNQKVINDLRDEVNVLLSKLQSADMWRQDLGQMQERYRGLERQFHNEVSARTQLQSSYDDRIREIAGIREDYRRLDTNLSSQFHQKDVIIHALREESARLQKQVSNERAEKQRAIKAYEEGRQDIQRLQEEANTLRVFLNQTDNHSVTDIAKDLGVLNSRIEHFANSLTMQWEDVDGASPPPSADALQIQQLHARGVLQAVIGDPFLDLLCARSMGPKDDRDGTLMLFALQACASHCIGSVFADFCYGLPYDGNRCLDEIYKTMYEHETQALSSRWRSLTHGYARSSMENYEDHAQGLITKALVTNISAVHKLMSGESENDETLQRDFQAELADIAQSTIALAVKIKEQMMSANFEVVGGFPGHPMEDCLMGDALGAGNDPNIQVGTVICMLEVGLVQTSRKQIKGSNLEADTVVVERRILQKAKVVTNESVGRFLEPEE